MPRTQLDYPEGFFDGGEHDRGDHGRWVAHEPVKSRPGESVWSRGGRALLACADDLPDEEAAVEDQVGLDEECKTSRVRGECFFPPGIPLLGLSRITAALKCPHPEETHFHEKRMAQNAKDQTPGVVEHARIDGDDGQWVCVFAERSWGLRRQCEWNEHTSTRSCAQIWVGTHIR